MEFLAHDSFKPLSNPGVDSQSPEYIKQSHHGNPCLLVGSDTNSTSLNEVERVS